MKKIEAHSNILLFFRAHAYHFEGQQMLILH